MYFFPVPCAYSTLFTTGQMTHTGKLTDYGPSTSIFRGCDKHAEKYWYGCRGAADEVPLPCCC